MALTLSEYLLRDFAVDRVDSMLIELGGDGKVRFPSMPRACFHLVLSGTTLLSLEDVEQPVELNTGDFALLLYGADHTLYSIARSCIPASAGWQQKSLPCCDWAAEPTVRAF